MQLKAKRDNLMWLYGWNIPYVWSPKNEKRSMLIEYSGMTSKARQYYYIKKAKCFYQVINRVERTKPK